MSKLVERGIRALYEDDPERADYLVFGRVSGSNRRGFLKSAGLAAMGTWVGANIPFSANYPAGLIPAALADTETPFVIPGKQGLSILNDRPVNAETPAHLLDDPVTPNHRHFIRNNGLVPESARKMDASGWSLTIDGEVTKPLTLSLADLMTEFPAVTLQLQLECGGNGRAGFNPPARGNQWTVGAIGCAEWTGARVADVLEAAGVKKSAVYTGYYGADKHLSGDPEKVVISRGAPMWKMTDPHTILAYRMNGDPLPHWHGFPLRIVAPGWPGSVSGKWLTRIWLRDRVHDGAKMTGKSYRVPAHPMGPGVKVPEEDWQIIESMPVKSLITRPRTGTVLTAGARKLEVGGHAWAGDNLVTRVDLSIDFGATWSKAHLDAPRNRYAWQNWRALITFPTNGYYEIWARATDDEGRAQPFGIVWNAKGYLNNSMHRIAVTVSA